MGHIEETYRLRTSGSLALYERSCVVVPGGVHHLYRYYAPYPVYMVKGAGSHIWDVDGNDYVDVWCAHYAALLGHAPAFILDEIKRVADFGTHFGIPSENEVRLAEILVDLLPGVDKVKFGVSGTEATMYAVRLARGYTGRNTILKVAGGWHGPSSDLTIGIAPPFPEPDSAGLVPEITKYTRIIPYNDIEATRAVMDEVGDDFAGVIVEPVMGVSFEPADREYLVFLREETSRRGAILIFDEIICGLRLGLGGGAERFDVIPDLSTFGKVAGGGFHFGFIGGREEVMAMSSLAAADGSQRVLVGGGTYSCNPMSMVAGRMMVEYMIANAATVYPRLEEIGARLRVGLKRVLEEAGLRVIIPGIASLCTVMIMREEPPAGATSVERLLLADQARINLLSLGLLNEDVFNHHARFALSYAHSDEDVDAIIDGAARAAAAVVAES